MSGPFLPTLRARRRRSTALAAALAVLAACGGRSEADGPRLVVLYAPCSVSRAFLQPYDAGVPYTPNLAAFAAESCVFRRHNAEAGQSGTDFAALFTGTQAYRHGVYCHPKKIDGRLFQISEAYAQAGYDTFFWSGQAMGAWNLGYGQGVSQEHAYVHGARDLDAYTAVDGRFAAILERLAREPDYRAFVQVNFTVSHSPYHRGMTPAMLNEFARLYPAEAAGVTSEMLQRYLTLLDGNKEKNRLDLQWDFADAVETFGLDAEDVADLDRVQRLAYKVKIHLLDTQFGKLVDSIRAAGLLERSLVAFTADHGETFYREGALTQWAHGGELAPDVLSIPLIVRAPGLGVRAGSSYEAVTRSIDVFPTLCGLSRVRIPADAPVDGADLAAAVRGEAPPPHLLAYSHTTTLEGAHVAIHAENPLGETFFPRPDPALLWVRVRDGDLVCQHRNLDGTRWGYQVYDLARDPEQARDIYDPADPVQRALVQKLDAYKELLVAGYGKALVGELSPEESLERLQDLGYAAQD